jgi:hypothetical protein
MPRLVVGRPDSEHISIDFRNRPWGDDQAWIATEVTIHASPFRGTYAADWREEFLVGFRRELSELYETLTGFAELTSDWSETLRVRFTGDGKGHVSVVATARPRVGDPNAPRLDFGLPDIDQTDLPPIIDAVDALLRELPPRTDTPSK